MYMIPPLPTFSLDGHQDLDCHILEGSSMNSTSANNSPAPEPENASSSSPDESRSSGGRFRFVVCFKEKGKGVLVMSLLKVIVLLAQSPLRAPEGSLFRLHFLIFLHSILPAQKSSSG